MIDLERFYNLIHAPNGYRAFCTKFANGGLKPHWAQSTRDLLNQHGNLLNIPDLYHTCHMFNGPGTREAKNVVLYNCLVADIDIHFGKGEPDIDSLMDKLLPLEDTYGKMQINLSGGGGVHLYVPFQEPVEHAPWLSASKQFINDIKYIKGVDSQCTVDSSRVLRVPGTLHSKSGGRTEILQWGGSNYKCKYVNGHAYLADKKQQDYLDERYKDVTLETLVETCGHIANLAAGKEQSYDEWLACASVLRRISNGPEAFHFWSKQAQNYKDEEDCQTKLDSLSAHNCALCTTFQNIETGDNPCKPCAFRASKTNPLHNALQLDIKSSAELKPSQTPLPEGYYLEGNAIFLNAKTNPQAKGSGPIYVANTPFYVDALYQDPVTDKYMVNLAYWDQQKWKSITIPKGVALRPDGSKIVGDFITHEPNRWAMYMQDSLRLYESKEKESRVMATHFGWKKYKGEDVFVLGHDVIGSKGIIGHAYTDTQDDYMRKVAGYLTLIPGDEEDLYHEVYKLLNDYMSDPSIHFSSKLQVAASFMSPLIHIAAQTVPEAAFGGIMLNSWGESGGGKSLGTKVALSIYGKPGGDGIEGLMHGNISVAALWAALEKTRYLPFGLDEVLSNPIGQDAKELDNFIKSVSNGESAKRAMPDGKPRPSFPFNCVVLSSSQTSALDFVASGVNDMVVHASRMRMIEFHIPGRAIDLEGKSSKYDRFFSLFGVLGRRWLAHILKPGVRERFIAHLRAFTFGGFKSEARFIVKFLHMLRWTVEETGHGKAGVCCFPRGFADAFEVSQKDALFEADRRRQVTPVQLAVLAYMSRYRGLSLTYPELPNGVVAQTMRDPLADQWQSPAYIYGTVRMIEVLDPPSVAIPSEDFKQFYKDTVRDRNYTSDMGQLIREHSCRQAANVQILGRKDPTKKPHCYVFPKAVIQAWEDMAGEIGAAGKRKSLQKSE